MRRAPVIRLIPGKSAFLRGEDGVVIAEVDMPRFVSVGQTLELDGARFIVVQLSGMWPLCIDVLPLANATMLVIDFKSGRDLGLAPRIEPFPKDGDLYWYGGQQYLVRMPTALTVDLGQDKMGAENRIGTIYVEATYLEGDR